MKKIIIFFTVLLIGTGCTKKATIDLPPSEIKLVVTCFLNPDEDFISAVVRTSKPKFGTAQTTATLFDDVKNATLTLSDGSKSVNIPYDANFSFYYISSADFPIHPGTQYYLTVSTPDGKKVNASTTVPGDTLEIETVKTPIRKQDSTTFEHDINLVVKDEPQRTTYVVYHLTNHVESRALTNPNFPAFEGEYSWMYFDSDEKTAHSRFYHSSMNSHFSSDTIIRATLDISVLNCSREFYLYNKSVSEGAFTSPFSDPVMIYTNFDNGFGCFGAFRATDRVFRIR